jgi:hypothetical protein
MLQLLIDTKETKSGSVKEKASEVHQKLTKLMEKHKTPSPPPPPGESYGSFSAVFVM